MKRFILFLLLLLLNTGSVYAVTNFKADEKAVKEVLKNQIAAANKYDYSSFIKHFSPQYINSDGFSLDVYSKLVEETWSTYSNIQYGQKIKNISIMGDDAIAEVCETANSQVESQYNLKGFLKSIANNVYFLRKTNDGWKIVSDVILSEDTYLAFGEMTKSSPTLTVPYQVLANSNYTAMLEYKVPKDSIAIASLNQERVTYPQESAKENYRKLSDDGILERFFTANADDTNEYIVASVGLTRPILENKDLQVTITGVAYLIKRVNVVPENKFMDKTNIVPVSERLKTISNDSVKNEDKEQKELESTNSDSKKEIKQVSKKNEKKDRVDESVSDEGLVKQPKIKGKKEKVNKAEKKVEESSVEEIKEVKKKNLFSREKQKKEKRVKTPKEKKSKPQKDKALKGSFSPTPVDIPTTVIRNEVE